jgi:hypothetical protein
VEENKTFATGKFSTVNDATSTAKHELQYRRSMSTTMVVLIDSVLQTGYYFETQSHLPGQKPGWTGKKTNANIVLPGRMVVDIWNRS